MPNKPNLNKQDVQLANALLDRFGYKDVDGDGYREMPDGKPLVITRSSTPRAIDRETDELWKKALDSIKIKVAYNTQKWPDLLKQGPRGATSVLGPGLELFRHRWQLVRATAVQQNIGQSNFARLKLKEYDDLYERGATAADRAPRRWALYKAT